MSSLRGGLFSCSVAHYISHHVAAHIWADRLHLLRCDPLGLHLPPPPLPPSLHLALLSISLHLSTCLSSPVSPHPTETKLLPRLRQPLCTRLPGDRSLWRWWRILKRRRRSFSPGQINLQPCFFFFPSRSIAAVPLPPDDTRGRKTYRPLSGAEQRRKGRMDDVLFVLISQISHLLSPLFPPLLPPTQFFFSSFIHLVCPVFQSLITPPFHLWLPPYFSVLFDQSRQSVPTARSLS